MVLPSNEQDDEGASAAPSRRASTLASLPESRLGGPLSPGEHTSAVQAGGFESWADEQPGSAIKPIQAHAPIATHPLPRVSPRGRDAGFVAVRSEWGMA